MNIEQVILQGNVEIVSQIDEDTFKSDIAKAERVILVISCLGVVSSLGVIAWAALSF